MTCRVTFVVIASLLTASAWAENLVQNPGFDSSTTNWTNYSSSDVVAVYSTDDAAGSPTSGSASVTNVYASSTAAFSGFMQCVPVVEGSAYRIGATVKIPSGQTTSGYGGVTVYWRSNPDCTNYISGMTVPMETAGGWTSVYDFRTAPAGSQAASVLLDVYKIEAGDSLTAHLDNVVFELVLFHDDFENGDLLAWSSSSP